MLPKGEVPPATFWIYSKGKTQKEDIKDVLRCCKLKLSYQEKEERKKKEFKSKKKNRNQGLGNLYENVLNNVKSPCDVLKASVKYINIVI